jgi:integrase
MTSMPSKRKSWPARVYVGRDEHGKQQFHWLGRYPTKRERDAAVAAARAERPWEAPSSSETTCAELAGRYLTRYERLNKASSTDTTRGALGAFLRDFGARHVADITPVEAEDWAGTVPTSYVPRVVAMFNYARRLELVDRNPFEGLGGHKGRGRADLNPPTVIEMERLLDACDVLGAYAQQMRALITVGAYTGIRPGELYELRWPDIDLAANRITVSRRLYRGRVDVPKSGRPKTIALPPPARDALLRQPRRALELVFVSKTGCQLTASTVCQYWAIVRARAGLDETYDLYRCTKHYWVALLYRLGLSRRAIAAQMGWSERAVDSLLQTYGHADLVALAEVDALYADGPSLVQ